MNVKNVWFHILIKVPKSICMERYDILNNWAEKEESSPCRDLQVHWRKTKTKA